MKKALLLIAMMTLIMPAMAETETVQTKQFVPITEAMDKARIQHEADVRAGKATLDQQRTEIQNKVDAQKEVYEQEQEKQATKRSKLRKQNEEKKRKFKSSSYSPIQTIQQDEIYDYKVSDTVLNRNNEYAGTPKKIRDNNALDFTQLKNYVNGREIK